MVSIRVELRSTHDGATLRVLPRTTELDLDSFQNLNDELACAFRSISYKHRFHIYLTTAHHNHTNPTPTIAYIEHTALPCRKIGTRTPHYGSSYADTMARPAKGKTTRAPRPTPRAPRVGRIRKESVSDTVTVESTPTPTASSAHPPTHSGEHDHEHGHEQGYEHEVAGITDALEELEFDENGEVLPTPTAAPPPEPEPKPFRFLDLPSEIRCKIYAYHFQGAGQVLDLHHDNHRRIHRRLTLLRTCRLIYTEASHLFYSTHTFRVFSTTPGRFFKTKKHLLARLKPQQRACLTRLELRLGPGWSKPPKGWVVNEALGLAECINVRKLTVFVQIDPSMPFLDGFRKADGFYEAFSKSLLGELLAGLPALERVEFDAYESVRKGCPIMRNLLEITMENSRKICWGPERGWNDTDDDEAVAAELAPAVALLNGATQTLLAFA